MAPEFWSGIYGPEGVAGGIQRLYMLERCMTVIGTTLQESNSIQGESLMIDGSNTRTGFLLEIHPGFLGCCEHVEQVMFGAVVWCSSSC